MKKRCLCILLSFLSLTYNVTSQSISPQVIASSGTVLSQSGFSIEYTAGELAVATISMPANIITQGFHQTYTVSNPSGIEEGMDFNITAYPNPTYDKITIQRPAESMQPFLVYVSDLYGKNLRLFSWENESVCCDLSVLAAGTYIIHITGKENNQLIAHFKIQKLSNP